MLLISKSHYMFQYKITIYVLILNHDYLCQIILLEPFRNFFRPHILYLSKLLSVKYILEIKNVCPNF